MVTSTPSEGAQVLRDLFASISAEVVIAQKFISKDNKEEAFSRLSKLNAYLIQLGANLVRIENEAK